MRDSNRSPSIKRRFWGFPSTLLIWLTFFGTLSASAYQIRLGASPIDTLMFTAAECLALAYIYFSLRDGSVTMVTGRGAKGIRFTLDDDPKKYRLTLAFYYTLFLICASIFAVVRIRELSR